MIAELTFWQMFGTFFIAAAVGVLVAAVLVVIGGRAAHAYEKTMVSHAERFRGFSNKLKKKKLASYEEQKQILKEKAAGARKVQLVGLYGGIVYLAFHLTRAGIGITAVQGPLKWVLIVAIPLLVAGATAVLERRAAKIRAARLEAATDLAGEREATA